MTKVSFDQNGFLIFLFINPDTLVKISIKTNQKLKFNSELNTLTGCQISNEVRITVFFATNSNSNEDPIAVFWGKYNPQQLNSLLIQIHSSSLVDLDILDVPCLVFKQPTDQ